MRKNWGTARSPLSWSLLLAALVAIVAIGDGAAGHAAAPSSPWRLASFQAQASEPGGSGPKGGLLPGEMLLAGQSVSSYNGLYVLAMQTDGNLVEYGPTGNVVWAAGTNPNGSYLNMQTDGNLVVYSATNQALFSSGTPGDSGASLDLSDSGLLTLDMPDGVAIWGPGVLPSGSMLHAGQLLTSPTGRYKLVMQGDGNLVEYGPGASVMWAAGTNPKGSYANMQADGNLVVYSATNQALFSSQTPGDDGAFLVLSDFGFLTLDTGGGVVKWGPGVLVPGALLRAGQSLTSPNGAYVLTMETNGNLEQKDLAGQVMWMSGTTNRGSYLDMQADGNFVVYSASNQAVFASNTPGVAGAYFVLADDSAALYSPSGTVIWTPPFVLESG
jgi:hypothetical protein